MAARGPDLEKLVESWGPKLAKAFLQAVALIIDKIDIKVLTKMIRENDIEGAVRAVGLDPAQFRSLDRALGETYEAGGLAAIDTIPARREPSGLKLDILFDVRNPRAESWLRERSSTRVVEIVQDQQVAIRQALVAGLEAGDNPTTIAAKLVGKVDLKSGKRTGGTIGLTSTQEKWVRNYVDELKANSPAALTRSLRDKRFDKMVAKAIASGKPLDTETIAKIAASYNNRALKMRADAIGRTEAMASLHVAQDEGYRQAVESGQVKSKDVRKTWRSAGDGRVRETHRELNGHTVGFNESFRSPSGATLRFCGDPRAPASEVIQCRCWTEYRVDFLANVR